MHRAVQSKTTGSLRGFLPQGRGCSALREPTKIAPPFCSGARGAAGWPLSASLSSLPIWSWPRLHV